VFAARRERSDRRAGAAVVSGITCQGLFSGEWPAASFFFGKTMLSWRPHSASQQSTESHAHCCEDSC